MSLLLMILLLGVTTSVGVNSTFAPRCDLHLNPPAIDRGHALSTDPVQFGDGWTPASEEVVSRYFLLGLEECNAYVQSAPPELGTPHPPPYPKSGSEPLDGEGRCRGNAMLYSITGGVVIWRFGPALSQCRTYESCWFGLLTCGKVSHQKIATLAAESNPGKINSSTYAGFSMRSLYLATRVISRCEIAVPETRLLVSPPQQGPSSSPSHDVLLHRFTLTQPCAAARLEARLQFFYPAALVPGLDAVAVYDSAIFLGATEERCRPWTKCALFAKRTLPHCDVASFVPNPAPATHLSATMHQQHQHQHQQHASSPAHPGHLPVMWNVTDGWAEGCSSSNNSNSSSGASARASRPAVLPLCTRNSTYPGRWVGGDAAPPFCQGGGGADAAGAGLGLLASGDPCILHRLHAQYNTNEPLAEDTSGSANWYYAPYACRYHFYSAAEAGQCLRARSIRHIHFMGDSMSRDLYAAVQKVLGVAGVSDKSIKAATNERGHKLLEARTGTVALTESYFWSYMEIDWTYVAGKSKLGLSPPEVVVSDFALSHLGEPPALLDQFFEAYMGRLLKSNYTSVGPWRFFQTARDPRGMHHSNPRWNPEAFRVRSLALETAHARHGFAPLDSFGLLAGRLDTLRHLDRDGWHHHGSSRLQEAQILINLICNDDEHHRVIA